MASQFQNRLIGTVILVSLGVIFIPDLLTGKRIDTSEPVASVPLRPQAAQVMPPVSGAEGAVVVAATSAAVATPGVSGGVVTAQAAPEGVVVSATAGQGEQWAVDDVAATVTTDSESERPAATSKTSQQPAVVKAKREESKVSAEKPVAVTPPVRKPLQAGQIKSFAEVVADEAGSSSAKVVSPVETKPQTPPVAKPSAATGGTAWVIQAGVFSSNDNARQLVSKLRAGGMAANVVPVRNGSSTLYRVTVGPDVSRAKMDSLVPKVSQIGGTAAKVVAYSPLG
ncbi:MAG: SPOR domain-containing protein [Aeromonadaceae bacterium]